MYVYCVYILYYKSSRQSSDNFGESSGKRERKSCGVKGEELDGESLRKKNVDDDDDDCHDGVGLFTGGRESFADASTIVRALN